MGRALFRRHWIATVLLIGTIAIAQPLRAQNQAEAEDEGPEQPRRAAFMTEDQFDQWFFTDSADRTRERFESQLAWRVQELERKHGLSPEQKKKLELAGRRDIQRFFDSVQERKKCFDRVAVDRMQRAGIVRDIQAFRTETFAHGPLSGESLFVKTLARTLTPEQRATAEEAERLTTYASRVHWVVFPLDRQLRLNQEQHRRFVDAIVAETRPLKRYGELDDDAVIFQASRLPEARLKPIFNDDQWGKLQVRFDQAKRMGPDLIEEGYVSPRRPDVEQPEGAEDAANRKVMDNRGKR